MCPPHPERPSHLFPHPVPLACSKALALDVPIFPYIYNFIYLFLAVLGLHCWLFSSCGEWGLLSSGVRASHCSGFSCYRAPALERAGFRNCGSGL